MVIKTELIKNNLQQLSKKQMFSTHFQTKYIKLPNVLRISSTLVKQRHDAETLDKYKKQKKNSIVEYPY